LTEQRAWIQNKIQNCQQAAAQADSPAHAEYLKLQCDTRMTRERTQYLRGYSID
ncbi:lysozyme inhibitor LprI family protein, partial [Escherichia ruysiae]